MPVQHWLGTQMRVLVELVGLPGLAQVEQEWLRMKQAPVRVVQEVMWMDQ